MASTIDKVNELKDVVDKAVELIETLKVDKYFDYEDINFVDEVVDNLEFFKDNQLDN